MWAAALSTGRMFASTMADEMAAVWCAANVLGEARDWPYCVESCVVGKREVLPSARRARAKSAARAPVDSDTSRVNGLPRRCVSA